MQGSIGGKNIYGQVNNPVTTVEYKGGSTDTADVSVDSKKKAITADVKKLPNDLVVEDRTGEEVREIRFNGDEERTVVLKDWTLKEVEPETGSNVLEYSLIKDGEETGDRIIAPKLDRCLYKSETNASKWESAEGSLTGYLGNQSESAVKASVGFTLDNNISYLPSYPNVVGTYYAMASSDNSLTGKLNLTPVNGASSPLLSFSGTGSLSMGTRSLYLDDGWFSQSTDNISLKIPAKSGTLITEADAMGSVDVEVDDLDTDAVYLEDAQFDALRKYPKSVLALQSGTDYRYFAKLTDTSNGVGMKFVTSVKSDNGVKVGIATAAFDYDKAQYRLDVVHTDLVDIDKMIKIQKIPYGFYPTVDSDNNVSLKSYGVLTQSEIEAIKKLSDSYVLTDNGYPAFVKSIDENTVLIEDLGVCKAELNRAIPQNKRVERISLELISSKVFAFRPIGSPAELYTDYSLFGINFGQDGNSPTVSLNDDLYLYLQPLSKSFGGFTARTASDNSFIGDTKLSKNYYFRDTGSSETSTTFELRSDDGKFSISGDVNANKEKTSYWFVPGDGGVGSYTEVAITQKFNAGIPWCFFAWTEELASLIADDIDVSKPLNWVAGGANYPIHYNKTDGTEVTSKDFEIKYHRFNFGYGYGDVMDEIILHSERNDGKTLHIFFTTNNDNHFTVDYEHQNTFVKYTSLLGKVTQSNNYKLEQGIADNKTAIEAEAEARKTEVLELQEECSNITQGIQEFSNSVDIRFQEKEEEITKNFDSISALSSKEASDISDLRASIDEETATRKAVNKQIIEDVDYVKDEIIAIEEKLFDKWSLASLSFYYDDEEPK